MSPHHKVSSPLGGGNIINISLPVSTPGRRRWGCRPLGEGYPHGPLTQIRMGQSSGCHRCPWRGAPGVTPRAGNLAETTLAGAPIPITLTLTPGRRHRVADRPAGGDPPVPGPPAAALWIPSASHQAWSPGGSTSPQPASPQPPCTSPMPVSLCTYIDAWCPGPMEALGAGCG